MNAFLIISYSGRYGWQTIIECIQSIRKFSDNVIILVNNYNENKPSILEQYNIRYITNDNNGFELGAIKLGVLNNPDIDYFFIMHDSCRLINQIPKFISDKIFFGANIRDVAPVLDIVKNWCQLWWPNINVCEIKDNKPKYRMCQGLMGHFSKILLNLLFENKLKNINITCKAEAVASEALFGILIYESNNNIIYEHEGTLDDYISNRKQWKYIVKLPGGKGDNIPVRDVYINNPSVYLPFYYRNQKYNSLIDAISIYSKEKPQIVLEYYNQNRNAVLELTNHTNVLSKIVLNGQNDLTEIINKIKHSLWCIRHFNLF